MNILFLSILVNTNIAIKSRETVISPDHLKMLALNQGIGECSLLRIMILQIQETCSFLIL